MVQRLHLSRATDPETTDPQYAAETVLVRRDELRSLAARFHAAAFFAAAGYPEYEQALFRDALRLFGELEAREGD